jgi:hypothetical protein
MTFKIPCLANTNWIQEYVILAFPFFEQNTWQQSRPVIQYLWYLNATKVFLIGTADDLKPYDTHVDLPVYSIPTLPTTKVSAAQLAIIQKPFEKTPFKCPVFPMPASPNSQFVALGRERILYFSPIPMHNDSEHLQFTCRSGISDASISAGLSLLQLDSFCTFQYPSHVHHKFIQPIEETSPVYYSITDDIPSQNTVSKTTPVDTPYVILNLPPYAKYTLGIIAILAFLACTHCNISAIWKLYRRFRRFYHYFRRIAHQADLVPPPAPVIALIDSSAPRLRPLLT